MTYSPHNHTCKYGLDCHICGEFSERGRDCNPVFLISFWVIVFAITLSIWIGLIKWII